MKSNDQNLIPIREFLVNEVRIPTQFFLAPINTGFVDKQGQADSRLAEFHRVRSGNGIGISYVGNVAVDAFSRTSDSTPYFGDSHKWEEIASTISENGSVPGVQIACQRDDQIATRKWRNKDVDSYVRKQRRFINSLSEYELSNLISSFTNCCKKAIEYGFKVIQLHAAHGYLLSRLLSPQLNARSDDYGNDRTMVLKRIVDGIKELDSKVVVDVRVSAVNGLASKESEWQTTCETVGSLLDHGVDMISLSNGMYDVDRFQIYPTPKMGHACYAEKAIELASIYTNKLINFSGNIWDLGALNYKFNNLTFSIGRSLIADPFFVSKSLGGNANEIVKCERTGHCHYFSRGRANIECGVNQHLK